jgi:hypothetical protein
MSALCKKSVFVPSSVRGRRALIYYLLTWGALEEISKDVGEVIAEKVVSDRNLD